MIINIGFLENLNRIFCSMSAIIIIKSSYNAKTEKRKIIEDNKDKSGIYM
jgi:hypothetical protein